MNPPTLNDLCHRAEALAQDLLALRENERPPSPEWTPKFKVGDRVGVVHIAKLDARTGTITRFSPPSSTESAQYHVHPIGWFYESQLEPAPWTLSRHIPGFRPLEEGEQYHREDFTEAMLPEGWRPLLKGECPAPGDEAYVSWQKSWCAANGSPRTKEQWHTRTRRALPDTERERIPLEAGDVPPGSAIRPSITEPCFWYVILGTHNDGVSYAHREDVRFRSFLQMMQGDDVMLRPGSTEWEPCSKARKAQ